MSEALFKAPHRLELMALIAELAEPALSVVQIHDLMISRQAAIGDEQLLTRSSVSRNLRRLCDAGLLTESDLVGSYTRVESSIWTACRDLLRSVEALS